MKRIKRKPSEASSRAAYGVSSNNNNTVKLILLDRLKLLHAQKT